MITKVFQQYVQHGWKLVRIQEGQKGPRHTGWNREDRAETNPERVKWFSSAGLLHAYSGTCSLDVNRYDDAEEWLRVRGIELKDLFDAPDAVQIISGEANRGKLIYKLDEPLPSVKLADSAFELRSGTKNQRSTQCVLPPSRHPNGQEYRWKGEWRDLPPLPASLRAIWLEAIGPTVEREEIPPPSADMDELRDLLKDRDPDCGYEEWVRLGMVLNHETKGSQDGLALWNEWSAKGEKYPGFEELAAKWASFGNSPNPVTAASLRAQSAASPDEFDDCSTKTELVAIGDGLLADAEPRFPRPILQCLSDVKPEDVVWLWDRRLARGKLTLLVGDPGLGKSTAALDVACRISTGGEWPDGSCAPLGSVVILSAEDGLADVIAVRVERQGGDASRIYALTGIDSGKDDERMFSLDRDIGMLDQAMVQLGDVSLVIIDPISAYCGSKDSYKDAEIRQVLSPLSALAEKHGVCILCIGHLTKDPKQRALYRGLGSIGFVGAARIAFVVGRDPEDLEGRTCLLMPTKSNIGPRPPTITFEIGDDGKLLWGVERSGVDPDCVLSATGGSGKVKPRMLAEEFLIERLHGGAVAVSEVERDAERLDISLSTLRRAAKKLGVTKRHEGQPGTKNQRWMWSLPENAPKPDTLSNVAAFPVPEALRQLL